MFSNLFTLLKRHSVTILVLFLIISTAVGVELNSHSRCQLNILLTNDDGWNAPGIQILHKSLIEAGHKVTLVAPLQQQSGRSSAVTTAVGKPVEVTQQSEGVWSVHGTPVDSVKAAFGIVMADELPDLTISGANFGPNLGQQTALNSGTLGAALESSQAGIPAIAVSVGLLPEEHDTEPEFKSTIEGFTTAANFLNNFIDQLADKNGCTQPIPRGKVLSLNIPVPVSAIAGSFYAPLSANKLFSIHWYTDESGTNRIGYKAADKSFAYMNDDVGYFMRNNITVSLVSADLTDKASVKPPWIPSLHLKPETQH